jgi:hypothetical protein
MDGRRVKTVKLHAARPEEVDATAKPA